MKKSICVIVTIVFTLFASSLFAQSLLWARVMGGNGNEASQKIKVDQLGNVYTVGIFSDTISFNSGSFELVSAGNYDIFISKFDSTGAFVWAKQIGGPSNDFCSSLAIDASGNLYFTGKFEGFVDFDPNVGTSILSSLGNTDIFIEKLDANGNFLWVKQMGATGPQEGISVAVDPSNNVCVTGGFAGSVDFDPNVGVSNLSSTGGIDIFVVKLNSLGNLIWAKKMGGSSNENGRSIACDNNGNIYTTGILNSPSPCDFDPGSGVFNLTSNGAEDVFISKLDSTGNFLWAKVFGGPFNNDISYNLTVDPLGDIIINGSFYDIVDFDPGSSVYNLTSLGQADIFILKLDAFGNFVWAKNIGGSNYDYSVGIVTDITGSIYLNGAFPEGESIDFDPNSGIYNLTSTGLDDIFILKIDVNGAFVWVKSFGGVGYDGAASIDIDMAGNIYTAGYFDQMADFNPNADEYNLIAVQGQDGFIQKMSQTAAANCVPAQPMGIIGNSSVSPNSIQVFSVATVPNTTEYHWSLPLGWTGSSTTNTITVMVGDSSGTVSVVAQNNCGISTSSTILVSVCVVPAQPYITSGNTSVSVGDTETYTVAPVAGATSYAWTLPSDWTGNSTTNTINVTVGDSSGAVSVVAQNNCGSSSSYTILVSVCIDPAQPSIISGNTSVNAGSSATYSITPVAGATSYVWTLPSGWSGSSTSNSITVIAGASSGLISVSAVNSCGSSAPSTLAVVGSSGQTSNCTPALFKDLRPGFLDSYPENFRELNGTLYFSNNDGLWKTNGTEVGTTVIDSFSGLKEIEVLNNNLIFSVSSPSWQLWKSDGANTTLVKEFPNATSFDGIFNLTPANGFVFFTVNENYVRKLWRTDGTEAGTILVKDIDPTNYTSYNPGGYFEFNNNIYFNAGTTTTGQELWKSDGTEAGTTIVKDIRPGVASGHTNYGVYAILNNELYFYASDGVQYGLWKTDGSDAGTVFVKECLWISEISTINNIVYFSAYDIGANSGNTLYGEELWRSDGTPSGTYMLKDINIGQDGSKHNNYQFKAINSTIVFSATDGINGVELWKTDGTEAGTVLLKNINPDVINAQIGLSSAKVLNGFLYFSANNGTTGGELWKTDGTEAGTTLVADLYAGADGSSPFDFTVFNGNIFFRAESESAGVELWSCVAATPSSLADVEQNNRVSVFPNPSSGILNIELSDAINTELVVYNAIGQKVFVKNIHQKITTIDLNKLVDGVYSVHLKSGNAVSIKKVILKK